MIQFIEKDGALIFTVKVVPRASKSEIVGELNGALKVRIASPPVDGAANAELVKTLAKFCDVPKSTVEIIKGETSKTKQIKISDVNQADFNRLIERSADNAAQKQVTEPQQTERERD